MKIICDLVTSNLQFLGQGLSPKNRAKKSQINLGKNEKNIIFIMVQSSDNRTGTKYSITGNIAQCFERFANDGKCTIRLKQPNVELLINNCDPLQLRIFLKVLKTGQLPDGTSDSNCKKILQNLPQNHKKLKTAELNQKCRTELSISTKRELITTTFSHLLVKLEIVGLDLTEIPPSVFKLTRLQSLNFSANKIKTLPTTVAAQLKELNLSANLLGVSSYRTWRFFELPQIKNNLQNLDLSCNQLLVLPLQICNLKNLIKLELKDNHIRHFPPCFGNLSRLRNLNLSHNKIESIDSSFQKLRLEVLDISGNAKDGQHACIMYKPFPKREVPSLLQTAAVHVVRRRLDQSELPVTLQEMLLTLRRCKCLNPVWHTERSILLLNLSNITRQCITDIGDQHFPMSFYFCNKSNCLRANIV